MIPISWVVKPDVGHKMDAVESPSLADVVL